MLTSLVKEISELSSNGKFFLPENLSHLTAILFLYFYTFFSLFLYHFTAYVFVEHSSWLRPTYLAFLLLSVVAVKMFAFNSSYFQCSPFLITITNRLPRGRIRQYEYIMLPEKWLKANKHLRHILKFAFTLTLLKNRNFLKIFTLFFCYPLCVLLGNFGSSIQIYIEVYFYC